MHDLRYEDDDKDSNYVKESDEDTVNSMYKWFEGSEECENAGYETDEIEEITEVLPEVYEELIPFDVSIGMHPSIIEATADEYWSKQPGIEIWKQWNPEFIVAGMMNGIFDFDLNDFYQGEQKEKRRKTPKEQKKRTRKESWLKTLSQYTQKTTMLLKLKETKTEKNQRMKTMSYQTQKKTKRLRLEKTMILK